MESGRSAWGNRVVIVLIILVIGVLLTQVVSAYLVPQTAVMHLGNHRFEIQVADTDKTRRQGLSGTDELPADQAMLFVFDYNNRWSIWMKDMNYSIDIVWLDESKKVIDFALNAKPESYPTKTFTPHEDARYVVELKSGTVKAKGIRVGDQAVFTGTSKNL